MQITNPGFEPKTAKLCLQAPTTFLQAPGTLTMETAMLYQGELLILIL